MLDAVLQLDWKDVDENNTDTIIVKDETSEERIGKTQKTRVV